MLSQVHCHASFSSLRVNHSMDKSVTISSNTLAIRMDGLDHKVNP